MCADHIKPLVEPLDLDKPIQTRDGRPVILHADNLDKPGTQDQGGGPLVVSLPAYPGAAHYIVTRYERDGTPSNALLAKDYLVNVPAPKVSKTQTYWLKRNRKTGKVWLSDNTAYLSSKIEVLGSKELTITEGDCVGQKAPRCDCGRDDDCLAGGRRGEA